jgi:hypothetical protein
MFRTDRDALAQEVEELRQERAQLQAQNETMRTDLLARRQNPAEVRVPTHIYKQGVAHISPGERVALLRHEVESFPVWLAVVFHFLTFGIFPLIHFSNLHDRLPKAEHDDPSAGKAIGYTFIPYFQLYWIVFNTLRLTDRINLQFRLRGLPDRVPRGLALTTSVLTAVPYINVLSFMVLWPIAIAYLQRAANELAALGQDSSADLSTAAVQGWIAPNLDQPQLRVPLVQDLPGPADAREDDAEIEADEALRRRGGVG